MTFAVDWALITVKQQLSIYLPSSAKPDRTKKRESPKREEKRKSPGCDRAPTCFFCRLVGERAVGERAVGEGEWAVGERAAAMSSEKGESTVERRVIRRVTASAPPAASSPPSSPRSARWCLGPGGRPRRGLHSAAGAALSLHKEFFSFFFFFFNFYIKT